MTDEARPNHHAGNGAPATVVPEPPFAEQTRTLVHLARAGTLSTRSRRQEGYPFGSVARPMRWNLINSADPQAQLRIGYVWLELGRLDAGRIALAAARSGSVLLST